MRFKKLFLIIKFFIILSFKYFLLKYVTFIDNFYIFSTINRTYNKDNF